MAAETSSPATASVAEETAPEIEYHPEFKDPSGNIIIKSADGLCFRTHDYYLKANRLVLRAGYDGEIVS